MSKAVFFFLASLSLPAFAERTVICTCYIDYGLSFEIPGKIELVTNLPLRSEKLSALADSKCIATYAKQGLRAIQCTDGF